MKKFLGAIALASLSLLCMNASAQDVFSYTTSSSNIGLVGTQLQGTGTTANYFETAFGASGILNAQTPTNIRLLTITPMGNSATVASYNKSFNISVNLTYGLETKSFVFSPLTLIGNLSDAGSNTDTVAWGPLPGGIVSQFVGGKLFNVNLRNATDPGVIGSQGSDGTLAAFVTSVPEPGAVAMMVGMGITGLFGTFRYVRRRK